MPSSPNLQASDVQASTPPSSNPQTTVLAGGCFWCLEAVFDQAVGVKLVESGYMGGQTDNPTYHEVCTGQTGHAEVVRITFDPKEISYDELLEIFFVIHDPTTLNRQGNDMGTQYRSAIFYNSEEQRQRAARAIEAVNASHAWKNPVVTALEPEGKFYLAEKYHQDYYVNNSFQPYCQFVIAPKLHKFQKYFSQKIKA